MVRLIVSVLVFGLLLNGCAGLAVKEISSYKIEKKRAKLDLADPQPLELQDFDWIIITKDNAQEVFMSSTTKGVIPVVRIIGSKFDTDKPGDLTLRLREIYLQEIYQT